MTEENKTQSEQPIANKPVMQIDDKQAKTWCMLCHLTSLVLFLGIPFGNILGPLVVWLLKKNEIKGIDEHGKESLNFQISMTVYAAVAGFLCLILIGFLLLFGLLIANVVLVVIASMKANNGEVYKYPATIRFIR